MDIGIASAIGSVANGMMSYISAERAMEQDAEEAQRNRKFQEYMYHLQLNDQERLYNQYGIPTAQSRMYQEAGLNPTLMMKSGGQLQSSPVQAGSVPSGSAGHGYTVDPHIDLSGLDQALLTYAQAENIQEDTKTRMIENRFKVAKEYLGVKQQLSNLKLSDEERKNLEKRSKTLEVELKYMDDFLKARNDTQREEVGLKRNEAHLIQLQADNQEIVNRYQGKLSEATLRSVNSAAEAAYASAASSYADVGYKGQLSKTEITKRTFMRLEREGVKLDNQEKEMALDYLDDQLSLGIESMKKHVRQQGQDYWNPFRYAGQILGGAAAGSVAAGMKSQGARTVVRGFVP